MVVTSQTQRLIGAIGNLPDEPKALIGAVYRRGLSPADACVECNIPFEEYEARLSQALRALMGLNVVGGAHG